ncbi:MAG TPA: type II toxin-antitoxin system RelE/ParE family toxin [Dehalococcoidia bacterium]|nr:type II toxin-antitoxin system RelE/ParE family toxin [Dehalococcoidia bacterium]
MIRRIIWTDPAERDMVRLVRADSGIARRIYAAVQRFAETGRGDVKRLAGSRPPEYRLRVGDYRVRFQTRSETGHDPASGAETRTLVIEVLRILPRGGAYRD